jgi:hypothetical protein
MRKHHEGVLLDDQVLVGKTFIELVAILVDDCVEGDSNIPKCDDDVTSNIGVLRRLKSSR